MVSLLLGLIILGVVIVILLLLNPNEVRMSKDLSSKQHQVLSCESSSPKDTFFAPIQDYANVMHEIKFTYTDNTIDSAAYNYNATFSSEDIAKSQSSKMHWDYNEYISSTTIHQEDLTPVFNYYGNTVRVGLFFEKKNLISDISELLFLNKTEFGQINKYSANELSNLYKNKNFSCKINKFND